MEKNNAHTEQDNPALAQVRRTERKVIVPTAVSPSPEEKDNLKKIVNVIIFIAIAGVVLSIGGGITAFIISLKSQEKASSQSDILAKAKQAESYIPQITKEQEEFAKKAGKESTLDMFQKINAGKVKMEADPDAGINKNAAGLKNGNASGESEDGDSALAGGGQSGILGNANIPFGGTAFDNKGGDKEKPKLKPTFASFANNSFRPMRNSGQMSASGKNSKGKGASGLNSKFAQKYNSFKQPNLENGGKLFASSKSLRNAQKIPAARIGGREGRTSWQQAKAMNKMLRSAVIAEHFSTARAEVDVAWEGTTSDSVAENIIETGGLEESQGMVVEPEAGKEKKHSGGSKEPRDFTPDIPDVSDFIDVTPWQKELDAIRYMFLGAMALLGIAAMIADTQYGKPIAIGMAATATAACAAGVGLAITIMTKYEQSALGGMWLGICGAGLAACAVAAIAGIAAYKGAAGGVMGFLAAHVKAILMILALVGGIGGSVAMSQDTNTVDKDKAKQYCKDHPDNSSCKDQLEQYKKNYSYLPYSIEIFSEDISKKA